MVVATKFTLCGFVKGSVSEEAVQSIPIVSKPAPAGEPMQVYSAEIAMRPGHPYTFPKFERLALTQILKVESGSGSGPD